MKNLKIIKKFLKFQKSNKVRFFYVGFILFGYILGTLYPFTPLSSVKKFSSPIASENLIIAKELKKSLENKNFTLINVHVPYEGEIEKTDLFLEYDGIIAGKDRLPEDKSAQIILYCKSGNMSEKALVTIKSLGYTNVKHLVGGMDSWKKVGLEVLDLSRLSDDVLPEEGFTLPISWGDIAPRLIELGVIDKEKFEKTVAMEDNEKAVFMGKSDIPIKINAQNSQFVVDLLWALGLAQKSLVYEEGPMGKEYKDKAGQFASTGGWTLAKGSAMSHYNKHDLIPLTPDQHKKVMDIAVNVYRPCCGNHTAFPDCNHGMAALAAIELMVSKGLTDEEIYENVLKLNSFWFGGSYITTATYFARQGIPWSEVDAKEVLGSQYSSSQGAMQIAEMVGPIPYGEQSGGGCGA
ncbi:hypothetical protein A2V80_01920 [Candidatus Woesebacteria bacterium RBG_16_39_8b]|uniref:Rhodanese domain-containing protein n=1 Tax=Candidatus Woesebacteria bacterium RBG_16_39_8b TaxID=1802482 RepID=A0A1F7XD00_9BACT|nr:MAG: hypothetical protein A2V80_01920 [Candidatus Woesebacteria bacterium RBG_16_39_8b]